MAATRGFSGIGAGELRISVSEQGTTTTIELAGEWDLAHRDASRGAVGKALERGPECLVLDLSGVSFIDSSGVHVVVHAFKDCSALGTRLVIVPGPRSVQRVFEICGLVARLPFTPERVGPYLGR